MPSGKGTYGKKKGRPKKKGRRSALSIGFDHKDYKHSLDKLKDA